MNQKGFGPAHDRIDLTEDELRVIGRFEHDLDLAARSPAARNPATRSWLTLRGKAYYLCMRFRRRAIWLLPVAGVALGAALTVSLLLAIVCTAVWTIGFAALVTEVGAACRRMQGRHAAHGWAQSDPNAADGGR